jgi:uncharacterized protein (TIGR03067 family)
LAGEPVHAYPEPWTTRLRRWLDRHRLAVAAAAAVLHGVLWLAIFGWVGACTNYVRETISKVDMLLPWNTELVLKLSRPLSDRPLLSLVCLAGFIVLDCWVLQRLSRSSGARVLRELWSGLVVLVPSLLLCLATMATLTPFMKVVEGVTRTTDEQNKAVGRERTLLDDTWKLAGGERAGQALAEKEFNGSTFAFDQVRFAWVRGDDTTRGTYSLDLYRRPKVLRLSYWDGRHQKWIFQSGVYELEADRLRICLAPPGAVGEELPVGFATKENRCTLYTLQRMRTNAGK